NGYPFFEELADAAVDQISLESAQQSVDLSILRAVPNKRFLVGVIDLADESPVEDVELVAGRVRNALTFVAPERLLLAPCCGMRYRPRWKAFQKLTVLATAAGWVRVEL